MKRAMMSVLLTATMLFVCSCTVFQKNTSTISLASRLFKPSSSNNRSANAALVNAIINLSMLQNTVLTTDQRSVRPFCLHLYP